MGRGIISLSQYALIFLEGWLIMETYYGPKVQLTNSAIIINNYDMGDLPSLEYNFKIWDPLIHKNNIVGMYYDETKKRLYLPRGIDIDYVMRKIMSRIDCEFDEDGYSIIRCHPYARTKRILLKYSPKDERQEEALRFMLCMDKYATNSGKSQFSVNLPTGAGKTYCSTATIASLGIKTIIITSQSGILEQWKKAIIEYTDLSDRDIYKLEGSSSIDRIVAGHVRTERQIYLVTHATLKSYGDSRGWENVGKLFETLQIGLKIYDEAHQNFTNMTMIDFFTNVYRTYYVTATPKRSQQQENKIYSLYMKQIPSIKLFDEDSDPHTKYMAIRYNSNPRPSDLTNCKNAYGLNKPKYIEYLMGNENFWYMFDYIFNLVEKSGGKTLFYIGTNEAVKKVRDRIVRNYPEYANDVGIYTSLSDNKPQEREKRFILSTIKSAGAGEDIKGLKYSVILAEPFKSEVLAQQSLGRTRDHNTFYIELVDMGFRQIQNYYQYKKPIFEKYALSTKQYDIPRWKIKDIAQDAYYDRIHRGERALHFNTPPVKEVLKFNQPEIKQLLNFYDATIEQQAKD